MLADLTAQEPEPEPDGPEPEPPSEDEEPEPDVDRPSTLNGPAFEMPAPRRDRGSPEAPLFDTAPLVPVGELVAQLETAIATPSAAEQQLTVRREDLVSQAHALQVVDGASYQRAIDFTSTLQGMVQDGEAHFGPDIKRAYDLHRSLTAKRNAWTDPLTSAITALKTRAVAWFQAQRAAEAAEQRRRDEEAARLAREEAARKDAEAAALAQQGDVETARELQQEAQDLRHAPPAAAPVQSTVPKTRGAGVRENWTFEVTNKHDFVQAVARGEISLEAVIPNDVYLRARAKADKNTLRWPGVRIFDAGSMAIRGRR